MAWFAGRVSLGNFPDLTGAVNKISEGVKNFEKNFDSALGFEEKSESSSEGLWPSTSDNKALFEPMMAFVGQKGAENTVDSPKKCDTLQHPSTADNKSPLDEDPSTSPVTIEPQPAEEAIQAEKDYRDAGTEAGTGNKIEDSGETDDDSHKAYTDAHGVDMNTQPVLAEQYESNVDNDVSMDSFTHSQQKEGVETESPEKMQLVEIDSGVDVMKHGSDVIASDDSHSAIVLHGSRDEHREGENENVETNSPAQTVVSRDIQSVVGVKNPDSRLSSTEEIGLSVELSKSDVAETLPLNGEHSISAEEETAAIVKSLKLNHEDTSYGNDTKSQDSSSGASVPEAAESFFERETLKREMKMMESALQGAARQAQAKADEIAKLMNENEQLKAGIEDLRRKSNDETESLRVEYHQRLATLERKVYALTKERDTLRREQNKKTDAAALLKEKDEIINQVMAEGEELSKKQATQEATIRKLRAQIRELEEEKKGLITKLQVEENKVDSIKKDKATTEKLLQETIEKHQSELAGQKEYYTDALAAAKEAEALAEARANNEARNELESRLKEVEERESMLVQTLEELRQTLSRKEQQAVFREDMLRRDVEDLQKRYQASERRCEELITQVPESTRPLLRQIEAMQETTARRAEAWAAVERSLNSRLQEEEAKAAVAEERERSINERLSQTLSRINVLEAQISCLRAEQTQLTKSLEKERHRAAENRQDYLAAKEEADTHEGRANQLEEEIRELRKKHKQELHEAVASREILLQELEREKSARLDLERASRLQSSAATDLPSPARHSSAFENGKLIRKLSSTSSLSSMEESYYLQASLDSSDRSSERKNHGETTLSPYYMKSMTPNAFEAALRQKEGELTSYMSRLVSMESIRDSLAEELVKITAQCEKLKMEAAKLPGIHAELDALRRRHSAALELMGERDEELEELRADIVDLKEMYREQVNLLVNKIQVLSSSMRSS